MRTIAGLRADNGMTQQDLAKEMNVTVQTIRNWERNQPELSAKTVIALCRKFKVSADDLLGLN